MAAKPALSKAACLGSYWFCSGSISFEAVDNGGTAHAEHDGERDQPGGHGATAQEVVSIEPGHAM